MNMSRVAYDASKIEFMHDWDSNLFMDKMKDGAQNNRIGGSPSEINSWQANAAKLYSLLKQANVPDDVHIAFEYKSPLAGRVDCMLFAIGKDQKKHVIHIELKQWSNLTVAQIYDTGVFKVSAQVGGRYQILSHPSQQALGYQQNIENYIPMVSAADTELEGCAYCYNYAYSKLPRDLFADQYKPVMKVCPLHSSDGVADFAGELHDALAGGKGAQIFREFVNCPARPTKNLMNAAANMFRGQQEFVLLEDQMTSANTIFGMVDRAMANPDRKLALIVKGGPGTGKTVIALKVISELARKHPEIVAYFTTRSKALRETLISKLRKITTPGKSSAADLIRNIYTFRPAHFKEGAVDVLLVDEAHRIRKSSNYMADRGMVQTFLPQVLSLLYTAKVCVFFIDDRQGVSREEIGLSSVIADYAEHYSDRIASSVASFREELGCVEVSLKKTNAAIEEIKKNGPDETRLSTLLKKRDRLIRKQGEVYQLEQLSAQVKDVDVLSIELKSQFRCNGSDNYLDWLDEILYKDEGSTSVARLKFDKEYSFGICDTPEQLEAKIRSLNKPDGDSQQIARLVAGYCWTWSENLLPNGDLRKDVIIGDWSMPWETNQIPAQGPFAKKYAPSSDLWASHPMGINQVGCIFSAQGFEVDYVGVIMGPDIRFDEEKRMICGVEGHTHGLGVGDREFDLHIKNIYRVLLSRGKKGCYVYCCDKALADYLKRCAGLVTEKPKTGDAMVLGRIVPRVSEAAQWTEFLPYYEMRAACGYFGEGEPVEHSGWVKVSHMGKLTRNMFVVRACGKSMEPRIHDGDLCVFRANPAGSRQGKILLVQHREWPDPDYSGAFSIKKYESRKSYSADGEWRHEEIVLQPLNSAFEPIVITENDDEQFRVVAEFIGIAEEK